mmetsp:Transcript_21045/g.66494  ORF Transcript_21045/g.66494 Transcript_21045/m.66494 type:complete len:281 (-) Transcript_21045:1445-2287(-)
MPPSPAPASLLLRFQARHLEMGSRAVVTEVPALHTRTLSVASLWASKVDTAATPMAMACGVGSCATSAAVRSPDRNGPVASTSSGAEARGLAARREPPVSVRPPAGPSCTAANSASLASVLYICGAAAKQAPSSPRMGLAVSVAAVAGWSSPSTRSMRSSNAATREPKARPVASWLSFSKFRASASARTADSRACRDALSMDRTSHTSWMSCAVARPLVQLSSAMPPGGQRLASAASNRCRPASKRPRRSLAVVATSCAQRLASSTAPAVLACAARSPAT